MDVIFKCPSCGMVSHNTSDVREQYCGNCHAFIADLDKLGIRDSPVGTMVQRITCNVCGFAESLRLNVSAELLDKLSRKLLDKPVDQLEAVRCHAFIHGWMTLPVDGEMVDLCPACSTLLRTMAASQDHVSLN